MTSNTDRFPSTVALAAVLALAALLAVPVAGATTLATAPVPPDGRATTVAAAATVVDDAAASSSGSDGTATPGGDGNATATPDDGGDRTAAPPTATSSPTPVTATPLPTSVTATSSPAGNGTFVITGLETPGDLRVGDRLVVNATVTNRARSDGTGTLRYSLGGSTVASRTVTLGAGESRTIAFDLAFAELERAVGSVDPGTYVHGVMNESGDGTARRLRVTPDVDFTVERFDAPVEVAHGEPYIVLATVRNPGNTSITREVTYEFAGRAVADRPVTVAGGDDRQVAFEIGLSAVEAAVGPVENETTYDHGAVTGDSRRGGAVRVVRGSSANAAALAVESFEATDDVRPGDSYRVNLSVRNVDTADFEGQLSYRVDGAVVATEWTRVPIGERRTVGFRVRYEQVRDATRPLSSRSTVHGVFVGDDAVVTRPVSVHAPVGTATPRPTPTFAAPRPTDGTTASTPTGAPAGTATPTAGDRCERGFFTACGGTAMDETSLTLLGVLLSGLGIVYEMVRGRR